MNVSHGDKVIIAFLCCSAIKCQRAPRGYVDSIKICGNKSEANLIKYYPCNETKAVHVWKLQDYKID